MHYSEFDREYKLRTYFLILHFAGYIQGFNWSILYFIMRIQGFSGHIQGFVHRIQKFTFLTQFNCAKIKTNLVAVGRPTAPLLLGSILDFARTIQGFNWSILHFIRRIQGFNGHI